MTPGWAEHCAISEPQKSRHIADYIAGMTDRYALSRHREIFGATVLPDGFVVRSLREPSKALIDRISRLSEEFVVRSEEHTSELQSLMRISYAVFCLKTKKTTTYTSH